MRPRISSLRPSHWRDASTSNSRSSPTTVKPIYIYPGLLRHVRDHAVNLDAKCPAQIYRCMECTCDDHEQDCVHENACSICLDIFHHKDLVRRMPCSAKHVFHTRCIITWFSSAATHCPLCNEIIDDCKSSSRKLRRLTSASRFSHRRSTSSFSQEPALPVQVMNGNLEHETDASPALMLSSTAMNRPSSNSRSTIASPSTALRNSADTPRTFPTYLCNISIRSLFPSYLPSARNYSYIAYDQIRLNVDY